MLFSEHFNITPRRGDDWFDTILDADTLLFVDPFLVFKETSGRWSSAHRKIVAHFNRAFLLIAEGNRRPESIAYQKAIDLLLFPEPKELCLGYTATGTAGLGSGRVFAKLMAAAISDAIGRGLEHPTHFEELGVFNEGIGADRISDIASTILKAELVAYTQQIAERHGIALAPHELYGASFDARRQRWQTPSVRVPTNPATGGPLLLVPQRFLRDLPMLNAADWWDHWENEQLRTDVNYEIMNHVDKATIVATARRHPDSVRRWTESKEGELADPYDLDVDAKGVWQWDRATKAFTSTHPLSLAVATSDATFERVIEQIVAQYRLFVEEQGGWQLLWDRGRKEKPESAAQLLFRGIAQHYCKANNISLDAEVNLGRGPVDFKFSRGYRQRAHLEVKKGHNGKFWNGLEAQLPSYMKSDEVRYGWFMSLRYRDGRQWDERERQLPGRVDAVATRRNLELSYVRIDARPKESASRLRRS